MPPSLLSLLSFHLAQPNVYATFSPDSSEPRSHLEMATLASRCLWPTTASSSIFLPGTYFRGKCRFSKASQLCRTTGLGETSWGLLGVNFRILC